MANPPPPKPGVMPELVEIDEATFELVIERSPTMGFMPDVGVSDGTTTTIATADLRADGPVPLFRRDLELVRSPKGGFYEVTSPATKRKFTLYDFELSLARMLDGRRRMDAVVEAGRRIGIPVDATTLVQFIRQIDRYGFLLPPLSPGAPDASREPREMWSDHTRELFQTGLRMSRTGQLAEALSYFEAIVQLDSTNTEARRALDRTRQLIETDLTVDVATPWVGADAAVPPPPVTASPPPAPAAPTLTLRVLAPFFVISLVIAVVASLVTSFMLRTPAVIATPTPPVAERAPVIEPAPLPPVAPAPVPPPPPIAAAPVKLAPTVVTIAVTGRSRVEVARITAEKAGKMDWDVREGTRVDAGDRLGTLEVRLSSSAREKLEAARAAVTASDGAELDAAKARLAELEEKSPDKIPVIAPAAGVLTDRTRGNRKLKRGADLVTLVAADTWHLAADVAAGQAGDCRVVEVDGTRSASCTRGADGVDATAPWLDATIPVRLEFTVAAPARP